MYVTCLISMPCVLSKIWARQESIMKKKWLRGDNYAKYRVGLWFLSTGLPLTAIYL